MLNVATNHNLGKQNLYYITKYVAPCLEPDAYLTALILTALALIKLATTRTLVFSISGVVFYVL